ncbi:MAG: branched-chain-amino-acid transaminase [Firmicutes bacterium]|nr:branched-chain-amino-acid transaminase [Bacillota bacterium]
MSVEVYVNGSFYPQEEAKVSVFDHGYLYGDGVFEGIRAYDGRIFRLDEHVQRLYNSAKAILLDIPIPREEMRRVIVDSVRRNHLRDAYIRPVVSRGPGDLGLDPRKCPRATVVVVADTIRLYPQSLYETGMQVVSVATRRNHNESISPRIKSLNYLNSIMAKIEANHLGYPEVVILNAEGYVAEGTGDNIFVLRRGELLTPPVTAGILEGITRDTVMNLARRLDIPVREALFNRYDLYTADECFLTGTAAEVIPVVACDGRSIGSGRPGPVVTSLIQAYRELVHREGTPVYE